MSHVVAEGSKEAMKSCTSPFVALQAAVRINKRIHSAAQRAIKNHSGFSPETKISARMNTHGARISTS